MLVTGGNLFSFGSRYLRPSRPKFTGAHFANWLSAGRMGHPPGRSIFHSRHLLLFLQQRLIISSIG